MDKDKFKQLESNLSSSVFDRELWEDAFKEFNKDKNKNLNVNCASCRPRVYYHLKQKYGQ